MSIKKYEFYIPKNLLPLGFEYAEDYSEFADCELPDLDPWSFYYSFNELVTYGYYGLKKRYPSRVLVPFARRVDNDDVACFDASESSGSPSVIIIHDFASPGWEVRGECKNFNDWVELAKKESKEYKDYFFWKRHFNNDKDDFD